MDPDKVELSSIGKMFEYEKQSREIDECNDIEELKMMLKTSIKLYLKQQEVVSTLGIRQI
jgi:hypothetical protein